MKISAEMPHIILEFLPPYSPDYNLIELVWHSAKEYIAHQLFELSVVICSKQHDCLAA